VIKVAREWHIRMRLLQQQQPSFMPFSAVNYMDQTTPLFYHIPYFSQTR